MHADNKISPQKSPMTLSSGRFAAAVLGATAVSVSAMVYFFNPSTHGFYPVCLFHTLTGLNCPGCGMTRALYALLHGKPRLALKDNALLVLALAALAIGSGRLVARKLRNRPTEFDLPPKVLWTLLIVTIGFAVLRNLPGFDWLRP